MPDIFDKKITLAQYAGDYIGVGWHEVVVYQFEYDSNNSEKPFINVTFLDENGKIIRKPFYLTKAAMWNWVKFSLCFGIKESEELSAREITSRIQGKKIRINVIKKTSDDGKEYHNVDRFEPVQQEPNLPYEDFQGDNPGYVPPEENEVASQYIEVDDPF